MRNTVNYALKAKKNTHNRLSFLIVTLTLLFVGVGQMQASGGSEGTTITVYAVGGHISWASSIWDEETSTLKIDCRRQGNDDDFNTYGNAYLNEDMTNIGYTYSGNAIYSYTFKELNDGAQIRLKHYKNGVWQEDYTAAWAGTSTINGKIYDGYYSSAHQWLAFGRDITIYAVPELMNGATWNEESHTLYANFKYGDGDAEWIKTQMTRTAYTYKGEPIYSVTMFIRYNVIKRVEFLYNDGSDHELYAYNPSPQHTTDSIDGKIFIGAVNTVHTWNDFYVRDYAIYYDMNGGNWHSGWVGTRTYGEGDRALSSDVTKTDYNFDGWYDNGSFTGDPVTAVSGTLANNITLYAKWAGFAKTTLTPALNPIICTAAAGDVVVITVSSTLSDGAYIQLEDKDGVAFGSSVPVSAGTYAIPLTSADAAKVNAGLIVSGSNCTIGAVTIKYQQTLWTGNVSDNKGWTQSADIGYSIFADLSAGDFLGVNISAINDGAGWHQYALRAGYENQLFSGSLSEPATKTHQLTADMVTALKAETVKDLCAQYLDISALYTYIDTKDYTVELHNNDGRVWADSVGSYTFGIGATLPTSVIKWNYNFDGWYDNAELTGDPVSAITAGDYGRKDYYAKWTSIEQAYPIALHPEFLAAQEGDIIVVDVTSAQTGASIYLKDANYTDIANRSLAAAGRQAFLLSAAAAAGVRTYGLRVDGQNFTFSDVQIFYRKTVWDESLTSTNNWTSTSAFTRSYFDDLAEGDFLGVDISAIGDGCKDDKNQDVTWHTYTFQANYHNFDLSGSVDAAGLYLHQLTEAQVDSFQNRSVTVGLACMTLDHLYTYVANRYYSVTLNANEGVINSGNITEYTYQTGATLPDDVTRDGYVFGGWYDNESLTGDAVTAVSASDLGNKTYYAKWNVVIYRTGDMEGDSHAPVGAVESFDGGTVSGTIEYRMKVRTLDQWYSLCLPFEVSAVKVWDDVEGYNDLLPYYRPEVGGTLYQGHYYFRTPKQTSALPISEFSDWRDPAAYGAKPEKDKPYIVQWHHSYFLNKYVSFFGTAGQNIPTEFTAEGAPSGDKVVNVCVNRTMISGNVPGAYVLVADYGGGAWLRGEKADDEVTIRPFECYLRADGGSTGLFMAIRRDMTFENQPTGWDDIINSEPNGIVQVYTLSGMLVAQWSNCSITEAAERLHSTNLEGLFILHADNESVKLMVGGK